jgi:hypothetical protein
MDAFSILDFVVRSVFAVLFNKASVSSSSLTLTGILVASFLNRNILATTKTQKC